MTLLLDPLLLSPPGRPGAPLSAASDFWHRIIEWAADRRVRIGLETHAVIMAEYAEHGFPAQDLTLDVPTLRREYQAALSILLARVQSHTAEVGDRTFSPQYAGGDTYRLALEMDVSGTARARINGIATAPGHWEDESTWLEIEPPPPGLLELCCRPGAELDCERSERVFSFFAGKRVHIVGGQVDRRVLGSICERLGIDDASVTWIPCEKAKPPRDLDKKWRALDPQRDVTVCVTGRVGHATSGVALRAASRAGVPHLVVELPTGIEAALVDLAG